MNRKKAVEKNGKIGFIYSTWDGVSFLWPDFFRLIQKFWPGFDEYFDGYISMNETQSITVSDKLTIEPIGLSNEHSTYSERLNACIDKLNCEYVFIMIDDFYLRSPVDVKRLQETVELIRNDRKIDYIEYENFRSYTDDYRTSAKHLPYLRKLKKKMFLCNLQIGIWRASSMKKVMRLNENPWMFEYYGSVRACIYNFNVLTIKKGEPPIFNYDFGWLLTRGKFDKIIYDSFVSTLGIDPEMGPRIGYHDREAPKKVPLLKKLYHGIKAVLSMLGK